MIWQTQTITKPIEPKLGSFQEWKSEAVEGVHGAVEGVAELFEMPIHTYLYSPAGTKRMVIKQTPFKTNKPLKFANHVYSVYNNPIDSISIMINFLLTLEHL